MTRKILEIKTLKHRLKAFKGRGHLTSTLIAESQEKMLNKRIYSERRASDAPTSSNVVPDGATGIQEAVVHAI